MAGPNTCRICHRKHRPVRDANKALDNMVVDSITSSQPRQIIMGYFLAKPVWILVLGVLVNGSKRFKTTARTSYQAYRFVTNDCKHLYIAAYSWGRIRWSHYVAQGSWHVRRLESTLHVGYSGEEISVSHLKTCSALMSCVKISYHPYM